MALHHLWNDVRFALRQFARRRGLTLAALFALACGLGGVTTVFTLVDAVILRPLPVASPGQLVWLRDPSFSFPVFQEVSARGGMLSHVFAWDSRVFRAQWTSEPESTQVLLATGGIHETLGLRPAAGRLLTPSDSGQSAADAQAVAVLSYSAWQRRFGAEPSAIGQTPPYRGNAVHDRRRDAARLLRRGRRRAGGRHHPADDPAAAARGRAWSVGEPGNSWYTSWADCDRG